MAYTIAGGVMIEQKENVFVISTENTSYMIGILDTGHPVHLGYGPLVDSVPSMETLYGRVRPNIGTAAYWDEEHRDIFPANLPLEYSTPWRGDNSEPAVIVEYGNGCTALDLLYRGHRIYRGKDTSFPASVPDSEGAETLEFELSDSVLPISLYLSYTVFPSSDVIIRSARIVNGTDEAVLLRSIASMQLDISSDGWELVTFDGAWARERYEHRRPLLPGVTAVGSRLGCSGNEHNPLIYLENGRGEVYGFNLIYSGCHRECIDVSPFGRTRVLTGINPYGFSWRLMPGESFSAPEAVMTYSRSGREKAVLSFHSFINDHIVSGYWKGRERPVLLNSWEASYFSFDEERVLSLAEAGKELGIELFVLDDGWFGKRTDDTKGLGDWYPNRDRFPGGMGKFAEKIRSMGLMFGIWMEPEMVNFDSDLYRAHPDWVIALPGRKPLPCRHQYILDLSCQEVREYIMDAVSSVIDESGAAYIKWDMNRTFTDLFSYGSMGTAGELMHRYILGLYEVMGRLKERYPKVLFEGCASGGNRYDLGMLLFMPQIWASDNTDLHDRVMIEEGTLMGYPQSTMGAHVSASPGHQSLRVSRIDSRFSVAAFGAFGYELDVSALSDDDKESVRDEIAFYKKYRKVLQFGEFRVEHVSPNQRFWYSTLGKMTVAAEIQTLNEVHTGRLDRLRLPCAADGKMYRVTARKERIPESSGAAGGMTEDFSIEVSGTVLREYGAALGPQFTGNGFSEGTRILGDFGSRLYVIEEV